MPILLRVSTHFLSPPLHRHHPLFTFIILQDSFISSNVKKRFCYGIFRTICIYIIYLGLQFGWNRNSFSLTCHVFNSNNKREKFKKIIIIFMVFYSFLFPIFSLFYDTPNQHRSELARFKRAKYARKKVSPWKPFRIFSRKSLLTSRVTAFLVEWRMPRRESHQTKFLKFPRLEMLCQWRSEAVVNEAGWKRRWLRHFFARRCRRLLYN